jgi:hypothetical protein
MRLTCACTDSVRETVSLTRYHYVDTGVTATARRSVDRDSMAFGFAEGVHHSSTSSKRGGDIRADKP